MNSSTLRAIALFASCLLLAAAAGAGAEQKPAEAAKGFALKAVGDKSLGVWEAGKPVFVYNHGMVSRQGVAVVIRG